MENKTCRGIELEIGSAAGVELEIGGADERVDAEIGDPIIIHGTAAVYDGETEVEPAFFEETVLETGGKLVEDNIRVKEIRLQAVSAPGGGKVYYIGT